MGIALSGGYNVYIEFDSSTPQVFVDGLKFSLLAAGWTLASTLYASVTGTFSVLPGIGDALQFGGLTYTFVAVLNNGIARQVYRGTTVAQALANLGAAINRTSGGAGSQYSSATLPNPLCSAAATSTDLTVSARIGGPYGTGIVSTWGTLKGGGYKLQAVSPQVGTSGAPSVFLSVTDDNITIGSVRLSSLQFVSTANPAVVSQVKYIRNASGRRHRCIACRCQFVCYVGGLDYDQSGSVVMGGIPRVIGSTVCMGEVPSETTVECWFAIGDYGGGARTTPRTALMTFGRPNYSDPLGTDGLYGSDGCYNGVATLGGNGAGSVRILDYSGCEDIPFSIAFGGVQNRALWVGGTGFEVEPLIAWGASTTDPPFIMGQLWDSMIHTPTANMDDMYTDGAGRFFVALTHQYWWGALWMLVPALTPSTGLDIEANYAY